VAGVLGAALVLVGVAFLGYGLSSALGPVLGLAGGAAVTGLLLLLPPIMWTLAKPPSLSAAPPQRTGYEHLWIAELSRLADRTPFIAVLIAVAVGAANNLLRRK
jgi:hypothetical protein